MRTAILHAIYAAIIISALYLAYDVGRFAGETQNTIRVINKRADDRN